MNLVKVRDVEIGKGIPKICVPIVGTTREEIFQALKGIQESEADIVEWRADWYEEVSELSAVEAILRKLREALGEKPLLFTFRTQKEGGEKEISVEYYKKLNLLAVKSGLADLVDVELFSGEETVKEIIAQAHAAGVKVIVSNHDFNQTPTEKEIVSRLRQMQELDADLPKIAVMPRNKRDVLTLLLATERMVSEDADRPIITMSMARPGVISRICGEFFGSAVTFGTAGKASAPGQMEVHDLAEVLGRLHKSLEYGNS